MARMRWFATVLVVGGALLLGGCGSQMEALAPVGGDDIVALRSASIDVLLERDLPIAEAPACTVEGAGYACTGRLVDGTEIAVTAPNADATTMRVVVGSDVVYEGSVQAVLDRAAGIE